MNAASAGCPGDPRRVPGTRRGRRPPSASSPPGMSAKVSIATAWTPVDEIGALGESRQRDAGRAARSPARPGPRAEARPSGRARSSREAPMEQEGDPVGPALRRRAGGARSSRPRGRRPRGRSAAASPIPRRCCSGRTAEVRERIGMVRWIDVDPPDGRASHGPAVHLGEIPTVARIRLVRPAHLARRTSGRPA